MSDSKIKSYIGFAIKSNNIAYGVDNITALKRPPRLVIYSKELSENSTAALLRYAERSGAPTVCAEDFKDYVSAENCKAIGLLSKELAEAVKERFDERRSI